MLRLCVLEALPPIPSGMTGQLFLLLPKASLLPNLELGQARHLAKLLLLG